MTPPVRPETPWHAQHPPEGWEQILQQALADHRKNPSDNEALQAIHDANDALNVYDQEGVEQSKLSSIPNDLRQVGGGALEAVKGLPAGMGQMLHHAGEGDFVGVGKDIVGGLKETAKGSLAPWELALRELGGETVHDTERNKMLHDSGGALVGLEAMALPGQIGRGVKALRSGGMPSMPRPFGEPTPRPPRPGSMEAKYGNPDLSKLDEGPFMDEYRKGTMTPEQADPYGLNDIPPKPKPNGPTQYPKYTGKPGQGDNFVERVGGLDDKSLDNFFKDNKLASDHPLHDILSNEELAKGPKPLTPDEINKLISGTNEPPKMPGSYVNANDPLHDILSPEQANEGPAPLSPADIDALLGDMSKPKRSMGTPPDVPPKGKFSTKGMDNDITPERPRTPRANVPSITGDATDFLSQVPGRVGRYARFAKLLQSMPDATSVRNKALTSALKSTTVSGMKPDSTRTSK